MPSSTAAFVADRASSIRSFFSFISTSVAAPTLMTATPPDSLPIRSCIFSLSKSEVEAAIWFLISVILSLIASEVPAPPTRMVFSLSITAWLTLPSISMLASASSIPRSEERTVPPVRIAISWSISFLLSPKPGAFTAAHLKVPRRLFRIMVVSASPSISSAMIRSFLPILTICSSIGRMS